MATSSRKPKTLDEASENVGAADAQLQSSITESLYLSGNLIAKREGYRNSNGIEAVQLYLITKYGWLPADVKGMSREDMAFVISEEKLR